MTRKRLPPALVALSPGDLRPVGVQTFLAVVDAALAAGLEAVLLREPELEDGALLELARAVSARVRATGGWLGVHDRAHVARAVDADGLHLGFRSLSVDEARPLVGPGTAIGLSTHEGDAPDSFANADYRFFGPVAEVPGKAYPLPPVGVGGVARAAASGPPVYALGGIDASLAGELAGSGAHGVAVLSRILGAGASAVSAAQSVRALLESWNRAAGRCR